MTAGPRVFGGRCLECGKVTTFTANGPGGALMCDSCDTVYPGTVYPRPDATHVRGDAAFRDGDGYRIFEDRRPAVPKPVYMRVATGTDVDGVSEMDSLYFAIGDRDAMRYIETRPGVRKEESGPGVTAYYVPQERGRWWRVRMTEDPEKAVSLNRKWRMRR